MDINIIISGNLTGFSRFYASPNANELYSEAKFDFDYRNFLSFINGGEKAYAISFSAKVVAVSLITRILDSFHRPGILVVTALIPRNQLVSDAMNTQEKSAIYRLLNEINDKFYEKNFMNGMINQNPAVLMQDYYSEILRNYTLVSDRMHKAVNATIEVNSPNKRIGFVSTEEKDMPKYLSSLMRKSYNGYHHVFFAEKAPANIDEPAEEVVTYRARIENGNRPIPGEVRLTDKIPTVAPEQGERPLANTNFTYGQVLNGDAGSDIIATIENGVIVLSFKFPQEEKTIYFKFFEGGNELPIHVVRPILVESDGTSLPISTDSFNFRGKEIYGRKIIKSGNPEYTVESASSVIDLQRYNNDATINVYVSKGWIWTFKPMDARTGRQVTIKPVDIILENQITGDKRRIPNVTGAISEHLPGSESEWIMKITSDFYEPISSTPNGSNYSFKPKQSQLASGGTSQRADNPQGNGQTKTQGHSTSSNDLTLTGGQNTTAVDTTQIKKEKKKRLIQYGLFGLVAVMCLGGGCWGYSKLFPSTPEPKQETTDPGSSTTPTETTATKNVSFRFVDFDGVELRNTIAEQLLISFEPSRIISKSTDGKYYTITYDSAAKPSQKIKVKVSFHDINMLKNGFPNILEIHSINDVVEIPLSVKGSDLKLYQDIEKGINAQDYSSYLDKVGKVIDRNHDYFLLLKNKLESQKPDESQKTGGGQQTGSNGTTQGHDSSETISQRYDDPGITLRILNSMTPKNDAEKKRAKALRNVLASLKNGKCPRTKDANELSKGQSDIVKQLIELNNKIEALPSTNDEEIQYKNGIRQKYQKGLMAKDKNNENSIYTAQEALSIKIDI